MPWGYHREPYSKSMMLKFNENIPPATHLPTQVKATRNSVNDYERIVNFSIKVASVYKRGLIDLIKDHYIFNCIKWRKHLPLITLPDTINIRDLHILRHPRKIYALSSDTANNSILFIGTNMISFPYEDDVLSTHKIDSKLDSYGCHSSNSCTRLLSDRQITSSVTIGTSVTTTNRSSASSSERAKGTQSSRTLQTKRFSLASCSKN